MKLTDSFKSKYIPQRVLITGLPGSGKTTLAAALATKYKLVWIDCEHGAETLLKLSPEQQENIELIRLPDSASYPIAADTLAALFKAGAGKICHQHGKFNCAICTKNAPNDFDSVDFSSLSSDTIVVIDSITQWSNSILAHIMKARTVDAKPERDDWGGLRKHTEFALSQMQAVPCNLICIAHAQEAAMEDGKVKLVPTFGSASMSTEVAKAFGHVIYCDVRNKKHVAFSSSTALPNVLTKSRTDFMIESLEVPSLIPIFEQSVIDHSIKAGAIIPPINPTAQPTGTPAERAFSNLKTRAEDKKGSV